MALSRPAHQRVTPTVGRSLHINMKPQTAFAILTLILASCISSPTATEFVKVMQIPTPINTPHAIPSSIGQITDEKAFDLYQGRINTFKNSLRFTIRILDVRLHTDGTLYIIKVEGTITNISAQPVVITETLRSGFTVEPEIYWSFSYNGKGLRYSDCCFDGWLNIDQDDYVVLQPNEFQRYNSEVSLPVALGNSERQDIYLSGKPITITATYINFRVGYALQNQDGSLVTTTDENGKRVFYTVDMNAWVGEVQSSPITYVFP